jgi:hypothetical protein
MATLEGVNKKYFHLSTRSWRLLADFIFDRCGDLIKEDERQGWHENYGKMISAETAIAVANRLERLIQEGIMERYEIELSIINMQSHFNEKILKRFIEFCRDSGGFDIW